VLMPCAAGSIVLVVVGVLINNLPSEQKYPQFWF